MVGPVKSLFGVAGPNASLKDAGGAGVGGITSFDLSYPRNDPNGIDAGLTTETRRGLDISPDGTKAFVCHASGTTTKVYRFQLSTPHDVFSATTPDRSTTLSVIDGGGFGLTFRPDGTRMFVVSQTEDRVYVYDLSTAWDTATATYVTRRNYSGYLQSIRFNPDGTKAFPIHQTGAGSGYGFEQHALSTPYDITTSTDEGSANLGGFDFDFAENGKSIFVVRSGENVDKYELAAPYDLLSSSPTLVGTFDSNDEPNPLSSIYGIVVPPSGNFLSLTGRYQTFSKIQLAYLEHEGMVFQVVDGVAE